jgi:hypothetical protein
MDAYETFLERLSYLSILNDSERVFAKRRALSLGQHRLFRYINKIHKVRNTQLRDELIGIYNSIYT